MRYIYRGNGMKSGFGETGNRIPETGGRVWVPGGSLIFYFIFLLGPIFRWVVLDVSIFCG